MTVWIAFGVGLFLGAVCGVFAICLLMLAKKGENNAEKYSQRGR